MTSAKTTITRRLKTFVTDMFEGDTSAKDLRDNWGWGIKKTQECKELEAQFPGKVYREISGYGFYTRQAEASLNGHLKDLKEFAQLQVRLNGRSVYSETGRTQQHLSRAWVVVELALE